MLYPSISLNEANSEDENLTILDYISSPHDEQPEELVELSINKQYIEGLLSKLNEEDKLIIMLKFGFLDGKERDKKEMMASLRKMGEVELQKKLESILDKLRDMADINKVNFL
jgi:DNA-directed RNA polymerase sigma subunit (sigma70/sigma32)